MLKCSNEQEIKGTLEVLKKEHKKATHICYAYRLKSPFAEKAVDDGEPSGTAGRPILNVLQKRNLQDVCVFIHLDDIRNYSARSNKIKTIWINVGFIVHQSCSTTINGSREVAIISAIAHNTVMTIYIK